MVLSKTSIIKLFSARKNALSAFRETYTFNNRCDSVQFMQFERALVAMGNNLNVNDANIADMLDYLVCIDVKSTITVIFLPLFGKLSNKHYITHHFRYSPHTASEQQSNLCTVHTKQLFLFMGDTGSLLHKKVPQNDKNHTVLDIRVFPLPMFYVNTGKLWHSGKFKALYVLKGKEKEFDEKYTLPQISRWKDPVFQRLQLGARKNKKIIAVRVTQKSDTTYCRNRVRIVVE